MDPNDYLPSGQDYVNTAKRKLSDMANSVKSTVATGVNDAKSAVSKYSGYDKFMQLGDMASSASGGQFPDQKWDNTQRNAARHSIWMALLANEMGGGTLARTAAKGIGYAHEGMGVMSGDNLTAAGAVDMRHDLNNNAVGLNTLADLNNQGQPTQQQIIDALIEKAKQSKISRAPSVLSPDTGYLTRGE